MEDYSSTCNDSVYAPYAHDRNDKRRISSSDPIFFSLGYASYLFRETFPGERGCCGGCWNTTCMLHKRVRGTTQPHPPNTVLSPFRHNCARPGGIILRLMGGRKAVPGHFQRLPHRILASRWDVDRDCSVRHAWSLTRSARLPSPSPSIMPPPWGFSDFESYPSPLLPQLGSIPLGLQSNYY